MSEQIETTATPVPQETAPTSTATEKTGGKVFTEEQVEQMLKERLDRERTKREKAAQDAAEKAAAEAAAKNGEWEKLAKANEAKLAEMQATIKARDIADLKRSIAEESGLPAALAARLTGETADDLRKDAKALAELLPKPIKPQSGPLPNPGGNGSTAETAAQAKARLFGLNSDPFTPENQKRLGGGYTQLTE